jgi:hypothetical protein
MSITDSATFPLKASIGRPEVADHGQIRIANCAMLFLLGASFTVQIQVVGTLYAAEIVLFFAAVFGTAQSFGLGGHWHRYILRSCGLILLMTVAYMASDIVNRNTFQNSLRGLARCAFLCVDVLGVYVVTKSRLSRLQVLVTGYALAQIAWTLLQLDVTGVTAAWKFGFALPLTILLVVFVPRLLRGTMFPSAAALLALGFVHMCLDYRSLAGVCMAVSAALAFRELDRLLRGTSRLLVGSFAAIGLIIITVNVYLLTQSEFSSRRAQGNAARIAGIATTLDAIRQSPLIGRGSWAYGDSFGSEYDSIYFELTGRRYLAQRSSDEQFGAHSQLLQSWYEAGILAAVYFIYLAVSLVRSLWRAIFRLPVDIYSPLVLQLLLLSTWHVLLSPFAGNHRLWIGLCTSTIAILYRQYKQMEQLQKRQFQSTAWIRGVET